MNLPRILTLLVLLIANIARAADPAPITRINNTTVTTLAITNPRLSPRDDRTAFITFDIAWEKSWRTPLNHDAAWVFFKLLPKGAAGWEHATLIGSGLNPPHCSTGDGSDIELLVPPDRLGLFVRRSKETAGVLSVQNIKVVCAMPPNAPNDIKDIAIRAMAVEMVYVPQGPNTVGSRGRERNDFHAGGMPKSTFTITSEDALNIADTEGNLFYTNTAGHGGDQLGPIPAPFPKGFAPFYCMKFELAEGQWVDFFNTLTDAQKPKRDITSNADGGKNTDEPVIFKFDPRRAPWIYRNTIAWTTGDATTQEPDLACGYLSWADGAAWTDWAALRPMTELEYEKACRAPKGAKTSWGIKYLPGGVNERAISVGNEIGRAFTPAHGDGKLDGDGNANAPTWPGPDEKGTGLHGGYGASFNPHAGPADRAYSLFEKGTRHYGFGARAVRSAPPEQHP